MKFFRLGELFCGSGGLGLAATTAKNSEFKIIHEWASDYDSDSCATYRRNLSSDCPESVILKDVRELDLKSLGEIDALAFGAPCNDFSIVGEQKGFDGKYGPLYSYGIKALQIYKPKFFLFENVNGIQSSNGGNAFKQILMDMKNAGYKLTPHLYYFEKYGVPQARHRVIVVGIRQDLPYEFRVPSPAPYQNIDVSCRTAIEVPPILENVANNERSHQSSLVIERLSYIHPGENVFTAKLPPRLQLKVKTAKISLLYKRLDPKKPAYTVTGSGGGGTYMYHWKEARSLTNRERARLQTFPDTYVFEGSKESVRRQIGMAVPVHGVRVIFEAILATFAEQYYPAINSNITIKLE